MTPIQKLELSQTIYDIIATAVNAECDQDITQVTLEKVVEKILKVIEESEDEEMVFLNKVMEMEYKKEEEQ